MTPIQTLCLYALTACAEILGCYLPLFVWLLTLHPHPAGRVYAAYGGVYIVISVLWLWLVDGVLPDRWDLVGASLVLAGVAVIYFAPRNVSL
jgi:small multidrug resistance family-3 protein